VEIRVAPGDGKHFSGDMGRIGRNPTFHGMKRQGIGSLPIARPREIHPVHAADTEYGYEKSRQGLG